MKIMWDYKFGNLFLYCNILFLGIYLLREIYLANIFIFSLACSRTPSLHATVHLSKLGMYAPFMGVHSFVEVFD